MPEEVTDERTLFSLSLPLVMVPRPSLKLERPRSLRLVSSLELDPFLVRCTLLPNHHVHKFLSTVVHPPALVTFPLRSTFFATAERDQIASTTSDQHEHTNTHTTFTAGSRPCSAEGSDPAFVGATSVFSFGTSAQLRPCRRNKEQPTQPQCNRHNPLLQEGVLPPNPLPSCWRRFASH